MTSSSFAAFMLLALFLAPEAAAPFLYENKELGLTVEFPSADWELSDHSQGIAKVLVFSPEENMSTRCTLMYLPASLLPEGLLTRETQIKSATGQAYKRVKYAPDKLAGKTVDLLTYTIKGSTTSEYGYRGGDFYFIFQLAAPDATWDAPEKRAMLDAIKESLKFTGAAQLAEVEVDRSTPEQIHEKRRKRHKKEHRTYEVVKHELEIDIEPKERSLKTRDRITIRAKQDGVESVSFTTSLVSVDEVESPTEITWETKDAPAGGATDRRSLIIKPATPLKDDQQLIVTVQTSSHDYFESLDQELVAELAVFGQVREKSSFSSHVFYYPVDDVNDAAMDISLTVPTGYTAVTGGTPAPSITRGDRTTFRYHTARGKPRELPFGFAVGKYISQSARSDGGLNLTVFGYEGEETLISQRVKVAVDSANVFERMMGPLPWDHVQFAHVTPQRKETGVSLPGFIIISDGFFKDLSTVDLSDGNLSRADGLSLLVIADELSHQWNFYSVPFPNELAEGISTFTNCLFIEHRHGREAYRKSIRYCRDAYLGVTKMSRDVAIADPAIYHTDGYRGIVFCKTPVILDMLRVDLGDDVFFKAWRKAFRDFDPEQDGFDIIQDAFSATAGRDLSRFFDQWFFMAGIPKIKLGFEQSGKEVKVTLRQLQPGRPYDLSTTLLVRGAKGETQRAAVRLADAETITQIKCDFEATEVVLDPDDVLLKELVK